jgi:hypothetical protein
MNISPAANRRVLSRWLTSPVLSARGGGGGETRLTIGWACPFGGGGRPQSSLLALGSAINSRQTLFRKAEYILHALNFCCSLLCRVRFFVPFAKLKVAKWLATSASCSGGPGFKPRSGDRLPLLQTNAGIGPQIRLQPLTSTSCLNRSLISLPFDAVYSELLAASLNVPQINGYLVVEYDVVLFRTQVLPFLRNVLSP